ncbi:MAG: hypothetical protein KZQ64_11775 [gamma proteobacterium symbiont of Bathyaustriella thionipta]|nr:hypothetical protein [gamma proteobacterium symbiont of Bathyaustriella thionipta]MCU7950118.1 hypothetical protein [gamma proteobacterium symbiont of Bathyaustriella thionipta]MCU7954050.1 hypothetical protein [gamma proteobacterium symbiont of Bathyaustriella thionipta]MCU7957972.1 hypothetical protein [gamma proteobacterium symbiont of Bathyaustriella thionipta]MCU7967241.1 hypothetical protein [gamma proteobacterium symbiont of Bathyaustriella thionipta]
MKTRHSIMVILLLLSISLSAQAVELIDKKGTFDSKAFDGKIYNDRGKYTGMITPEGKMYDAEGQFTGQIKNQAILDSNGAPKGFIRDGKIYNTDGSYKGRLKR